MGCSGQALRVPGWGLGRLLVLSGATCSPTSAAQRELRKPVSEEAE
jgi:hypothetical protein